MDVVEVSPPYDAGNNITALFANRCVMEAITGTAMRRLGLTSPDYADPRALGAAAAAPAASHPNGASPDGASPARM
jgi:hypothetical protein